MKNDNKRHALACHGTVKHDRKDVGYMARKITAQSWMAEYQKDSAPVKRLRGPLV